MTLRAFSSKTIQVWNLWHYHMSTKMLQYHLPCQVFHLCRRCQKSDWLMLKQRYPASAEWTQLGNSCYDHPVKKHEVILVDHTTSIKLVLWQEHWGKLEDQRNYALQLSKIQGDQWNPLPEHSKVRAVSLQRDSSFYTRLGISHYRDGVTNTEQNISQINWRSKRVKK